MRQDEVALAERIEAGQVAEQVEVVRVSVQAAPLAEAGAGAATLALAASAASAVTLVAPNSFSARRLT